ncbi:MAG: DNA repair protein RecN [Eubacteriales bacterium]|nr:DNA repair protein RecN [Eubacteriales bacterium]
MLENIHVKNLALIKEIDIAMGPGLLIVTGETGAGKSLIMGSVAIGLGAKVPKDFISEGAEEALVELTFRNPSPAVRNLLTENGIEASSDEILIQRMIRPKRTVNRINFQTVNLALLRQVGAYLIQMHGQHDNQILLDERMHIKILDRYGGTPVREARTAYEELHRRYRTLDAEIRTLTEQRKTRDTDMDYCNYVLREIDEAAVVIGEDDALRTTYRTAVARKNAYEDLLAAYAALDRGTADALAETVRILERTATTGEAYQNVYDIAVESEILIQNLQADLRNLIDADDYDDEMFQKMDARIDVLNHLKRKYGGTLEAVLAHRDEVAERLDALADSEERLTAMTAEREKAETALAEAAKILRARRVAAARQLEKEITAVLEELHFLQVVFEVRFTEYDGFGSDGTDGVSFYISLNVGHKPKPLADVSSGGELSRIMLALQSVITDMFDMESMIFDEIDAGISGKTAVMVARRLKAMGRRGQIICITHAPQIAAAGDRHFKIHKQVADGMTTTCLTPLNETEHLAEVARLLGGMEVTDATLANARELIQSMDKSVPPADAGGKRRE